jgi:hypothetical protein
MPFCAGAPPSFLPSTWRMIATGGAAVIAEIASSLSTARTGRRWRVSNERHGEGAVGLDCLHAD